MLLQVVHDFRQQTAVVIARRRKHCHVPLHASLHVRLLLLFFFVLLLLFLLLFSSWSRTASSALEGNREEGGRRRVGRPKVNSAGTR